MQGKEIEEEEPGAVSRLPGQKGVGAKTVTERSVWNSAALHPIPHSEGTQRVEKGS